MQPEEGEKGNQFSGELPADCLITACLMRLMNSPPGYDTNVCVDTYCTFHFGHYTFSLLFFSCMSHVVLQHLSDPVILTLNV